MKCPKCGYLGFDHVDRCRNCGYDFSLATDVPEAELPLRSKPPQTDTFPDLALIAPPTPPRTTDLNSDLDRILGGAPGRAEQPIAERSNGRSRGPAERPTSTGLARRVRKPPPLTWT